MASRTEKRRLPAGTRYLLLVVLWLGLNPASFAAVDGGAALESLQQWLDATRNLQGRFVQQLESGALGGGLEERGRFFIERPGKMRWDYVEPENKTAIVADDRTWLYVEEERQLILGRLDEREDLLTTLLAGGKRLDELFVASALPRESDGTVDIVRLRLDPKSATDALEWLILDLDPREYSIVGAEVMDAAGNRMRYRFQRLRRNRDLPAGLFVFEAPPGTHVAGTH